jgi:hypothetical protein
MAEHGIRPARKDCRHPPPFDGQRPMSDGVGTDMKSVESAAGEPALNRTPSDTQLIKLPAADDPMLSACDLTNRSVDLDGPGPDRRTFEVTSRAFDTYAMCIAGLVRHGPMVAEKYGRRARGRRPLTPTGQTKEAPARRCRLWL